jgi:aminopeptidase N
MIHTGCGGSYAASNFVLPGTVRKYPRARPFAIRHLSLDLDLLVDQKRIEGVATLELERADADADAVELDAIGFEITAVRLVIEDESRPAEWSYDGDQISVTIPKACQRASVEIEYSVTPRRGLYFLEPDDEVPTRPRQVWSQCQDQDARHWFPCHDSPDIKMTSELRVTVPNGWLALSNGELMEEPSKSPGERIFHFGFDAPHPSYLLTLVAGEFSVLEDRPATLADGRKVPIFYYVPQGREADGWRSFSETPMLIELFSRVTGVAFPWSRYSQIVVTDFTFGGMENTTATTLYEHSLLDERAAIDISSVDLVAHELAHQWFGDLVTCRDWSEAWLNEGFATYFEHVACEARLGRDEYDWGVLSDLDAYLAESNGHYMRPIVSREYQAPIDLFDRHLYQKGGLVLHMLRRELGDTAFWKGINAYLLRHREGIVETTDLKRAFEDASGHSLDRFFDQWVYQPGHLDLEVKATYEQGQLTVAAEQKLAEGALPLSYTFEIEVCLANGEIRRISRAVTGRQAAHVLMLPSRPKWVAVDPDLRIASPIALEMPSDFCIAALSGARSLRSRVLAAQTLSKRTDIPSITALRQRLNDSRETWMLRAECARCLGKMAVPESLSTLVAATGIEHPKVRRAVVASLSAWKHPQAFEAIRKLTTGDESYLVTAEACRSLGHTRHADALGVLRKSLEVESHADLVRAAAYDGLAALREPAAIDSVIEGTRYGNPSRARRAAIAALAALGSQRRERQALEDLLTDRDFYIRCEAARALVKFGDPNASAALSRQLGREHEGRVIREIRASLAALSAVGTDQVKRLSDEVRQLQRRVDELNARADRAGQLPTGTSGSSARLMAEPALSKRAVKTARPPKKVSKAQVRTGPKTKSKPLRRGKKRS